MSTITEEAMLAMADRLEWRQSPFDFKVAANMLRTLAAERTEKPVAWACGLDADMKGWIYTKAWSEGEFTIPLYRHAERTQQTGVVTDELMKTALRECWTIIKRVAGESDVLGGCDISALKREVPVVLSTKLADLEKDNG